MLFLGVVLTYHLLLWCLKHLLVNFLLFVGCLFCFVVFFSVVFCEVEMCMTNITDL